MDLADAPTLDGSGTVGDVVACPRSIVFMATKELFRNRVSFAAPIGVERVDDPAERRARAPELTAEGRTAIDRRLAGSARPWRPVAAGPGYP